MAMSDSKSQRDHCFVCGKDVSNAWFARIRRGEEWIKICSPACSIRYSDGPHSADDENVQTSNVGGHTFRFLVNGELWS